MPRLLVINPNTTASITDLCLRYVRTVVGDDIELIGATGRFGCAYISSEACYAVAAHAALDCYAEHGEGCDAVLLACFGDPGLFALREVSKLPVIGLAEASMQAAVERGGRFGIVTGGARWKPMLERFVAMLGAFGPPRRRAHGLADRRPDRREPRRRDRDAREGHAPRRPTRTARTRSSSAARR